MNWLKVIEALNRRSNSLHVLAESCPDRTSATYCAFQASSHTLGNLAGALLDGLEISEFDQRVSITSQDVEKL